MEQMSTALLQLGAVGVMIWWLTFKLVPQMQKEHTESLNAFQTEMKEERALHREVNKAIMEKTDRAVEGLLQHIERVH